MKRIELPGALRALVQELRSLPGIGPRSAERIALWLMQSPDARPRELSAALDRVGGEVAFCARCGFFVAGAECDVCADVQRDSGMICVVEQPTDVLPIERSGAYGGSYHVLGGRLSPLDDVGPEDLRIDVLIERVRSGGGGCEVILALGGDVEGEATASYLVERLAGLAGKVTRLAQGLPAGGGLEHADMLTVSRAIEHRR